MARKIIWSPAALDDVSAIAEYIDRDSRAYASAMVQRFIQGVERLESFPFIGRQVPEFRRSDVRELIISNYRIIYRVDKSAVVIAAVIHGARRLRKATKDREI